MAWDPNLAAIRDELAEIFRDQDDCRIIIDDLGMSTANIDLDGKSNTRWHNILLEALSQGRLDALIQYSIERSDSVNLRFEYLSYQRNYSAENAVGELDDILADEGFSEYYALLEKLKYQLSAGVRPIFVIAFIALIRKLRQTEADYESLAKMIDEAVSKKIFSEGSEFIDVYNSNKKFFILNLRQFQEELPLAAKSSILIPIVVLAMNREEATELSQGYLFDTGPEHVQNEFAKLKERLGESWIDNYGERADDWRPFHSNSLETIEALINSELKNFYTGKTAFTAKIIDVKSLIGADRRLNLKYLRIKDCILIVDVISLCHPIILKEFYESFLDVFENTFVFSITPLDDAIAAIRKMTFLMKIRISEMEFSKRIYDKTGEFGDCTESNDQRLFETWFSDKVGKMLKSQDGVDKYFFSNTSL